MPRPNDTGRTTRPDLSHPPGPSDPSGPSGPTEASPLSPPSPPSPLPTLAGALRALPPSCGPVRLIAVDGHAGSGKTTFAGLLAEALGGAPVLHLDDIASHAELFGWTGRLLDQVIAPLARGDDARYSPYDWHARAFGTPRALPVAPVVIVEGVGAGRRALRPYLARLLWLDVPHGTAWARGRTRDGAEQREFWAGWVAAEQRHFAEDPSRPYAEALVRQLPMGYMVLPGPVMSAGPDQIVTEGDDPTPMC